MTLQLSLSYESEVSVLTCQARCVLWCSSGIGCCGATNSSLTGFEDDVHILNVVKSPRDESRRRLV